MRRLRLVLLGPTSLATVQSMASFLGLLFVLAQLNGPVRPCTPLRRVCFPGPRATTPTQRPSSPICSHPHRPPRNARNRLRLMAWNGTGLASWKLDELRGWLHLQWFQVVIILETRWQFDREWTEDGWHHIANCGTPFRSCGILIMVRTTLCSPSQISWQTSIPGRLVHIRLHLNRPVDIVGCYHTRLSTHGNASKIDTCGFKPSMPCCTSFPNATT